MVVFLVKMHYRRKWPKNNFVSFVLEISMAKVLLVVAD